MHLTWTAVLVCCTLAQSTLAVESVQLKTQGGVLYGTLEIPAGNGPWPVALIIAGSGPTDRNGNSAGMKLVNNHLKLFAEALAKEGIASLRYDKRGIGQSAAAAPKEQELRFATYILDAQRWGKLLHDDARFSKLYVIGHSEGSLVGMIAARGLRAAGFVSIAGTGMPAGDLIREQLSRNVPEPLRSRGLEIIEQLENRRTVADVPPELSVLFRPSVQPYLISWFSIDPVAALEKLRCPVLIVDGETDIQVSAQHADLLTGANDSAAHRRIQGMNHVLKLVPEDAQQQMASYGNPELPVAEELVTVVSKFINEGLSVEERDDSQEGQATVQAEIVGQWESVDFVQRVDAFKPGSRSFQGDLFLKELECFPGGRTSKFFTWDDQWIIHANGQTKAQYVIKSIDGTKYLFLPWLSGDVVDRGMQPGYYVLRKAS